LVAAGKKVIIMFQKGDFVKHKLTGEVFIITYVGESIDVRNSEYKTFNFSEE